MSYSEWVWMPQTDKCDHGEGDGCYYCCQTCDLGGHTCPGCGDDTTHRNQVCEGCLMDLAEREA